MTGYNCTRCGKEFESGEVAYALDVGTIEELPIWGDVGFFSNDGAWEEVLCDDCHTEIFSSKPNRVVVEVKSGMVQNVRAERPDGVVVMVYASADTLEFPYQPLIYGGPSGLTIKQLNAVKEEA